jgi:hypothetical protein
MVKHDNALSHGSHDGDHHDAHHDHGHHLPTRPDEPLLEEPKGEIDYSKFDDRFDNRPRKIPLEPESLVTRREAYIRENALTWQKKVEFPRSYGSLEPMKFKKSPATRIWYRKCSSYERNGFFNILTQRTGLKLRYWLFYPVVVWGVTATVLEGMYAEEFDLTRDPDYKVYDKLAERAIPFARVWNRPG